MVILLATGIVPPAVAGLLAAGAIVLSGVLIVEQAYRGIAWTTVILVARDDPALDGDGLDAARPRSSPTAWSTSSATPARVRSCSGSSS